MQEVIPIKKKELQENKLYYISLLVLLLLFFIAILGFISSTKDKYENRPELTEQVEVVYKRILRSNGASNRQYSASYNYIVAFKFPNGFINELRVDRIVITDHSEEANSSLYDSIQEGDTGILTYKEVENIERYSNLNDRRNNRLFISFQKDSFKSGN